VGGGVRIESIYVRFLDGIQTIEGCGIGRRIVMDEAWMFSNVQAVSLDPLTKLRLSYDLTNQPAALRRLGNARGRRSALRRVARAARVLRRGRNGDLSPVAVKKAQR